MNDIVRWFSSVPIFFLVAISQSALLFGQEASVPTLAHAPTTAADALSTDPQVDEHLFLIYRLNDCHSRWPTDFTNREAATTALLRLRHDLIRTHTYLQGKNFDEGLVVMYGDSVAMAETYGEFLADIGAIDADFQRRQESVTTDALVGSVQQGVAIASSSPEPTVGAALALGGAIKQGVSAFLESQRLSQEKSAATNKRLDNYLAQRSRLISRIQEHAALLAEKNGWRQSEVGFDQSEDESQRILGALQGKDFRFLIAHAASAQAARPRDPFAFAQRGALLDTQAQGEREHHRHAAGLRLAAKLQYLRAAQLVPRGRFHDVLRSEYLFNAARNASLRLYHEPEADERDSVAIADAALQCQPRDPTGMLRLVKAFTLARNGQSEEGVALFDSCAGLLGDSAPIHFVWARLLSLADKPEESLSHLTSAWDKGFRDVRQLQNDRDLRCVRQASPEWFRSKKPRLDVEVRYGWLQNSVVVKNASGFPLTKAFVEVRQRKKTSGSHVEICALGNMAAGETREVSGVFEGVSKALVDEGGQSIRIACFETCETPHDRQAFVGSWRGVEAVMIDGGTAAPSSSPVNLRISQSGAGLRIVAVSESGEHNWGQCDCINGRIAAEGDEKRNGIYMTIDEGIGYGEFQSTQDRERGVVRSFMVRRTGDL